MKALPTQQRLSWALLALLLLLALVAGCGDENDSASTTGAAGLNDVTVYYVTEEGSLVGGVRQTKNLDPLSGALAVFQSAPPIEGGLPALRDGARILSSELAGSVALIDMNMAFAESIPPGGAQAQTEALAPLVYTASAVEGVESVSLTIEGESPDIAGLAFDLSEPITTADLPIEVTEPTP